MSEENPKPKQLHAGLLIALSFLAFVVTYTLDQTLRWTDHLLGFITGLFYSLIFGAAWIVIYVLPWTLLITWLYRRNKWQRFRSAWVFLLSLSWPILILTSLLTDPPTPHARFKRITDVDLPAEIKNLHWHFRGGGMADITDVYLFETTPEELDRLIVKMNLKQEDKSHETFDPNDNRFTNFPPIEPWKKPKRYTGGIDGPVAPNPSFRLVTNEARTQAHLTISTW